MTTSPAQDNEAWYRNGWVWLIIGIPVATIAGCLLTLYLALAHPDERVRDPAAKTSSQAGR